MRIQNILLIFMTAIAVSCSPRNMQLSIETPLPPTNEPLNLHTAIAPTIDLLEKRMQIQSPINTLHAVPTPIGMIASQDYFDLHDKRGKYFENKLQLTIDVLDVFLYSNESRPPIYVVMAEGVLKNISEVPIVVRKELRTGPMSSEVTAILSYNGADFRNDSFYDGVYDLNQDDYTVLDPGEFQRYSLRFLFELEMTSHEGERVSLEQNNFKLSAEYINIHSGYRVLDANGVASSPYMDLNAWVGIIKSNEVDVLFP